jgi:hypothetical protein
MNSLVAIQHWLYGGMTSGLGDVAGGDARAIFAAMAAAILFGTAHALMPGHGKTVLVTEPRTARQAARGNRQRGYPRADPCRARPGPGPRGFRGHQ